MSLFAGDAGPHLTAERVRHLTAADLGAEPPEAPPDAIAPAGLHVEEAADPFPDIEPLPTDDPYLAEVDDLLQRYGGVIFTGPPGTSKSWYAHRIGVHLAGRVPERVRFVQFHPSYQYEDFVKGFVPKEDGSGFTLEDKHLLEMCAIAEGLDGDARAVIVIDELSRGEPGRIFGEALTYVELSKRGLQFRIATGEERSIPPNLVFLATMNPLDRGVDEVDAAFERRFAKIRMAPRPEQVILALHEAGMSEPLRHRVEAFFRHVIDLAEENPAAQLGHTYFRGVEDVDGLRSLWEHQLSFHFEKAYRLDPDGLAEIRQRWDEVLQVDTAEELTLAPDDADDPVGPEPVGDIPEVAEGVAGTEDLSPVEPTGEQDAEPGAAST